MYIYEQLDDGAAGNEWVETQMFVEGSPQVPDLPTHVQVGIMANVHEFDMTMQPLAAQLDYVRFSTPMSEADCTPKD